MKLNRIDLAAKFFGLSAREEKKRQKKKEKKAWKRMRDVKQKSKEKRREIFKKKARKYAIAFTPTRLNKRTYSFPRATVSLLSVLGIADVILRLSK